MSMSVGQILKALEGFSSETTYNVVTTILNDIDNDKYSASSSQEDYEKVVGICEKLKEQEESHPRKVLKATPNQLYCLKFFLAENINSDCNTPEDVRDAVRKLEQSK